jgi:hypothetical protein
VPTPAAYLGTTLLAQAASLAGMAANKWFRDADYLFVRTGVAEPEGSPKNYPYCVLNYKNAHLRKGSPMPAWNLSRLGVPVVHERLITTLNRVMSHEGLEWNFVHMPAKEANIHGRWQAEPWICRWSGIFLDFKSPIY